MRQGRLSAGEQAATRDLAIDILDGLRGLTASRDIPREQYMYRARSTANYLFQRDWGDEDERLHGLTQEAGRFFQNLAWDRGQAIRWIANMGADDLARALGAYLTYPAEADLVMQMSGPKVGRDCGLAEVVRAGKYLADLSEMDPEFSVAGPGLVAQHERLRVHGPDVPWAKDEGAERVRRTVERLHDSGSRM
jgi:hypothetical protein